MIRIVVLTLVYAGAMVFLGKHYGSAVFFSMPSILILLFGSPLIAALYLVVMDALSRRPTDNFGRYFLWSGWLGSVIGFFQIWQNIYKRYGNAYPNYDLGSVFVVALQTSFYGLIAYLVCLGFYGHKIKDRGICLEEILYTLLIIVAIAVAKWR